MPHRNHQLSRDQINLSYQYDAEDIKKILESRLKDIQANIPRTNQANVCVSSTVNLSAQEDQVDSLMQILHKEKNNPGSKTLLIPCNIPTLAVNDNGHWTGILIESRSDGSIERADYFDSSYTSNSVPPEVQEMFATVYNDTVLQLATCMKQDANDYVSSGPYLVENLLRSAFQFKHPEIRDVLLLRGMDIEALINYDDSFSKVFLNVKQTLALYKLLVNRGDINKWGKHQIKIDTNLYLQMNNNIYPLKGQVHFYMNSVTGEVFYGRDFKIKLDAPGNPVVKIEDVINQTLKVRGKYDCKM